MAEELPNAGEELGQDVSAEEEARELAATEDADSDEQAGETSEEVEAAERDDPEAESAEVLSADSDVEPGDEGGQSGDEEGLSDEPEASSESVEELADEGQAFEAEIVDGVENAPLADEGERIIRERPETPNENRPDEEESGQQR